MANGSRGLCGAHYNLRLEQIRRGETTWSELEAKRLALPVKAFGWKAQRDAFFARRRNKK